MQTPPQQPLTPEEIVKTAEQAKQKGDRLMVKSKYDDAIHAYEDCIELMKRFAGGPTGEVIAAQALANKAHCQNKSDEFEAAIETLDFALTIPIVSFDVNLMSKIYYRKSLSLQALGKLGDAIVMIDRAICIGGGDTQGIEDLRKTLVAELNEANEANVNAGGEDEGFQVPDHPDTISPNEANEAIQEIIASKKNPDRVIPYLQHKFETLKTGKVWWDRREEHAKVNMIFAVCNVAIMKALEQDKKRKKKIAEATSTDGATTSTTTAAAATSTTAEGGGEEINEKEEDPDDVLNLLAFLLSKGCRAEQRYPLQGNKTPLQMLCMAGAFKCAELCMNFGALSRVYDDQIWTPLLVALAPDRPNNHKTAAPFVKLLLERQALVNHSNKSGLTALSLAAQSGDAESVRILVNHKDISLNLRSKVNYFSSIVWAKLGGNQECVSLIKNAAFERDTSEKGELKMEIVQDCLCVDFSNLVHRLLNLPSRIEAADTESMDRACLEFIRMIFRIDVPAAASVEEDGDAASTSSSSSSSSSTPLQEFSSEYERMHYTLFSQFPLVAFQKFGQKDPTGTPLDKAKIANSVAKILPRIPFLWQTQFNQIYLIHGPPKDGLLPITCNERNDYYYLTWFNEYHSFVVEPMQRRYGYFIPSVAALTKMHAALTSSTSSESGSSRLVSLSFKQANNNALHTSSILTTFLEKFPGIPSKSVEINSDGSLEPMSSFLDSLGSGDVFFCDVASLASSSLSSIGKPEWFEALSELLVNKLKGKMYFAGFDEFKIGEKDYRAQGSFSDLDDVIRSISMSVLSKFKKRGEFKISLISGIPNWFVAHHAIFAIEKDE